MNSLSCSISSFFLSFDLNGTSKWRKISFSIGTLNLFSLCSLAHSHRLNASYDSGCCGLSSFTTSSTSCCLSASSSSSNRSLGLRSISPGSYFFVWPLQGGKRSSSLGSWSAILLCQISDRSARLLPFAYRLTPAEGQL